MGFWSSFLGHAAANAINETQKETKKHNDLCYQLSDYMDELNKYLERIGCKQVYIADYGCIDTGSISIEKRKMDTIKRKVEEYKNLGGNPAYIQDLDEMDEHITVIKYLKSVNRLDRQKEFLGLDLEFVKDDIEREIKEETSVLSLVNVQGNILNTVVTKGNDLFISYDNWEESANTIKIDTAKYYSEDTIQFLEYKTISLIFTETNIYVYSYELDAHSQLYCNIPVGKNQKINITSLPIPAVAGWSMVVIDDLQVLCSTDEAEKIMELYRKHNADIYLEEEMLQQKNINELSGIEFERVCQQLVEKMGFETETTKASGDGGIDLIAYNHQPLLSGKYIIQCKRYSGSVGEPIIRDLYGVITSERANKGILMTTGHFTRSAIAFAEGKPIELIDGKKLNALLLQHNCIIGENADYNIFNLSEENQIYTIEELFNNNPLINSDYYYEMINELSSEYKDKICAKLINYLVSKIDIMDFDEQLSIIPEIKKYILQYIQHDKENEECKWLSFLYMMCYIQFSILSGDFGDAKSMAAKLMKNKELLFTSSEFVEPNYTSEICEKHIGIFVCLYDTLYNMVQCGNIIKDEELKEHVNHEYYFSMVKIIFRNWLEDSIRNIDADDQYAESRLAYWNSEIEASVNIDEINRIYLISDFELEMYYNYAYENGMVNSLSPDSYKMEMLRNFVSQENEMTYSDWYLAFKYNDGTFLGILYNLSSKIEKYNMEK